MATKRKLKALSVPEKYAAIVDIEKGTPKVQVAQRLDVPLNTISTWWKNREKIKTAFNTGSYEGLFVLNVLHVHVSFLGHLICKTIYWHNSLTIVYIFTNLIISVCAN